MAKKTAPWQSDALEAVRCLKSGGVLLHATDTVWGLAASAKDGEAIRRVNRMKGRPENQPLIVLVASDGDMERLLPDLPDAAWELIESSDRPITVLAQPGKQHGLDEALIGPDGRLAVRWIRNDPYTEFVIRGAGRLASTSANLNGAATPEKFADIPESLLSEADHIASHRREESAPAQPSMMVAFDAEGRFEMLRG